MIRKDAEFLIVNYLLFDISFSVSNCCSSLSFELDLLVFLSLWSSYAPQASEFEFVEGDTQGCDHYHEGSDELKGVQVFIKYHYVTNVGVDDVHIAQKRGKTCPILLVCDNCRNHTSCVEEGSPIRLEPHHRCVLCQSQLPSNCCFDGD